LTLMAVALFHGSISSIRLRCRGRGSG
jgi:hypothetical protein